MTRAQRVRGLVAALVAAVSLTAPAGADPLDGSPSAQLDNPFLRAFNNGYAQTLAFAGDVDGDGDDELLVAAPWWSGNDTWGRIALYPGSSGGVSSEPVTVRSPRGSYGFGRTMGSAGDIDADGYDDVVIADFSWAYVYYGSAHGLQRPDRIPMPDQTLYYVSVSGAGDVNGDGFDDVVVGAGDWDGTFRNQGRVDVHLGSATGLRPRTIRLTGARQQGALFGSDVAPAGDVDGDGFDDIVVGAPWWRDGDGPREGRVIVYRGAADGIAGPAWHADPTDLKGARFGSVLGPAGDVNGDGYGDVVLGAFAGTHDVYVYLGSEDGTRRPAIRRSAPGADGEGFGAAVAGAGDLDGDGFDDLVVGAPYADGDVTGEGRTFVLLGDEQGLATTVAGTTNDPTDQRGSEYGQTVAAGGDLDGDGSPDLAVGATRLPVENWRGRVYVFDWMN